MSANATQVRIVKADGEEEFFDTSKLDRSLARAGASSDMRSRIVEHVYKELKDGMTTQEIYKHAFDILKEEERHPVAARFSIKRAIFDFGPSGYPFERFVAEILKVRGWRTEVGVIVSGRCAQHEVDVIAAKDGERLAVEAKFHNNGSVKTDIKDALYVHARFEDLIEKRGSDDAIGDGWLVTNTRFSKNAIRYGQCVGLIMYGWDYPKGKGIQTMIEETRVHPITCLTTLTEGEKRQLLQNNIVLCQSLHGGEHILREYGVSPKRIPDVLNEARHLCSELSALPSEGEK